MGIVDGRDYFRTHLNLLGYHEHKDAFDINNVPDARMHNAYHLSTTGLSGIDLNQSDHKLDVLTTLRVYKKLYKNTSAEFDKALTSFDAILKELLKMTNILNGNVINVQHEDADFIPYNENNDNILMAEFNFNVRIALAVN